MKKFIGKCKKWLSEKPSLYWIIGIQVTLLFVISAIAIVYFRYDILNSLGLLEKYKEEIGAGQFYRNKGFAITAIVGLSLTATGIGLTIWGRAQTQEQLKLNRDSNASERYENAARMLGDDISAVRIAGCEALRNLGIANRDMALQCVQLLFSFVNNPYFSKKEKEEMDRLWAEKNIQEYSAIYEAIGADTQTSIQSLGAICKHYYEKAETLDLGVVKLPDHIWKSNQIGNIVLPKASLFDANLQGVSLPFAVFKEANLRSVNLSQANLSNINFQNAVLFMADFNNSDLLCAKFQGADISSVNFSEANLMMSNFSGATISRANLSGADISGADMRTVKGLTKRQILSAKWEEFSEDEGAPWEPFPPELPYELLQDEDIQKWLEDEDYGKSEE